MDSKPNVLPAIAADSIALIKISKVTVRPNYQLGSVSVNISIHNKNYIYFFYLLP